MATEVSGQERQIRLTGIRSDEELDELSLRERHREYELQGYRSLKRTLVPILLLGLVMWLVQWWLAPSWLVDSRSDADTLLTALPVVAIALLTVMIAGLLVAVQVAAESYRSTGIGILIRDMRTWAWVYMVIGIASVALLLGALAPANGDPSSGLTAALATLTILFAIVFLFSGRLLKMRLGEYTSPFAISQFASVSAYAALDEEDWGKFERHWEETGLVALYAVRDQDSNALVFGLGTLEELFRTCLSGHDPPVAVGVRVSAIMVRMGEETIGLDSFVDSSREISNSLYRMARFALETSNALVATELINGLGRLATRSWTFATVGLFIKQEPSNLTTPLDGLADLAWRASPDDPVAAAAAVECWALGVAYLYREAAAHPPSGRAQQLARRTVFDSVREFGHEPNWKAAFDALLQRSYLWALAWQEDAKELLAGLVSASERRSMLSVGAVIEATATTWTE